MSRHRGKDRRQGSLMKVMGLLFTAAALPTLTGVSYRVTNKKMYGKNGQISEATGKRQEKLSSMGWVMVGTGGHQMDLSNGVSKTVF